MTVRVFDGASVLADVTLVDAIQAVREGFVAFANGEFEMPARTVLREGRFLSMSTHHIPSATTSVKTLSLSFGRRQPAIVGSVTWHDLATTQQVIADAAAVTELRTAAATGVATDLLAAPGAIATTVLGAGAQAASQARAICAVRPIERVTLWARDGDAAAELAVQLRAELSEVDVVVEADVHRAVSDADIICCATSASDPLFDADDVRPDVHINAIGSYTPSMRELPRGLFSDAAVFVDDRDAALRESGEIVDAVAAGVLLERDLTELGRALQSASAWSEGRTVFKSVGVAMQDWAVCRLLAEAAIGTAP